MRFDWTDLRVFLHACETGSMTQAAARSHLTLAAVSARIRALEDHSGVPLLRRHARGVIPTPAGEALARHARLVAHQLDALRRDLQGPGGAPRANTLVLANSAALTRPLSGAIGDVLARHPGDALSLRESSSEVTVHALHSGAADLGLVADSVSTEGLLAEPLGPDPLVLIAAPGHPLATRQVLPFREALAQPWISWGDAGALHTHLAMRAHQAGASLRVVASVPAPEDVLALVMRGLGVSVLPRVLVRRLAPVRPPALLRIEEPWAQRMLLVCRSRESRSPLAADLFDALRAQWGQMDGG